MVYSLHFTSVQGCNKILKIETRCQNFRLLPMSIPSPADVYKRTRREASRSLHSANTLLARRTSQSDDLKRNFRQKNFARKNNTVFVRGRPMISQMNWYRYRIAKNEHFAEHSFGMEINWLQLGDFGALRFLRIKTAAHEAVTIIIGL